MLPRTERKFNLFRQIRINPSLCLPLVLLGLLNGVVLGQVADSGYSLSVTDDGRRIMDSEGGVFFWLGDTAWELFHRLDRAQADLYLEDRAAKGFNVIQAVVLAELDGLRVPNPYGETPLIDLDPTRPNEAYFEHVDYIVNKAAELGLYIGMLPTWGDKFNLKWGVGPEIFHPDNALVFGRYLGSRYADAPVIWILGGDRAPEEPDDLAIVRAMAKGIEEGDAGRNLMTYHPQGGMKSWEWFHGDDWLDFNFFQSGHGMPDRANFEFTQEAWQLSPVKPVIDGEPRYEDHPIGWRPQEGWFGAFDVRQAAYWSVMAGAAGHTYGNHNIWQMWQPGREPVSSARTPWPEALAHRGAAQMGFMKRLFLSRPFLQLTPMQSLVKRQYDTPRHVAAAADTLNRFAMVYSPYGWTIELDLSDFGADTLTGWWFDPRTGAATRIGTFRREDAMTFEPPGEGKRGNDWVLVLDDASQNFAAPGSGIIAGRP